VVSVERASIKDTVVEGNSMMRSTTPSRPIWSLIAVLPESRPGKHLLDDSRIARVRRQGKSFRLRHGKLALDFDPTGHNAIQGSFIFTSWNARRRSRRLVPLFAPLFAALTASVGRVVRVGRGAVCAISISRELDRFAARRRAVPRGARRSPALATFLHSAVWLLMVAAMMLP
jgi:hypothetical protein